MVKLRVRLGKVEHYSELVAGYDRPALQGMAKVAGTWRSGTKKQLAIGLLNWRNYARQRGQAAYREAMEYLSTRPRQQGLFG